MKKRFAYLGAIALALGIFPALYYLFGVPDLKDNKTSQTFSRIAMFMIIAIVVALVADWKKGDD
jgi:membrane protein DedA with SNARE-associated domain